MTLSDLILNVLSFLMLVVLAWFSFQVANIVVTIFKQKKQDKSFRFCFNTTGKIVYIIATIIFVGTYIGGIVVIIKGIEYDKLSWFRNSLNAMALVTLLYSYLLSSLIMLGKKEMMIGRMLIDYRKMKKVSFSLQDKVSFIFSQKEYSFNTRFTDVMEIRRALKK
jgi:hypothetical protein